MKRLGVAVFSACSPSSDKSDFLLVLRVGVDGVSVLSTMSSICCDLLRVASAISETKRHCAERTWLWFLGLDDGPSSAA